MKVDRDAITLDQFSISLYFLNWNSFLGIADVILLSDWRGNESLENRFRRAGSEHRETRERV